MRDELVISSSVAAIADPTNVDDLDGYTFVIGSMHFFNNQIPHISASGITGAETVDLWKLTGGTWVAVYDGSGSAVSLTATNPQESILGEGTYGLSKSAGTGIEAFVQMP